MADSDKPEDEFVQFVCFKIEGKLPVELFQNTWIPVAEKLFSRGINTVMLSEKLPLRSDTSPYKFISKNCWESIEAIKSTFPGGVPPPNSRGNISVSQCGIFKLVHEAKGDDTTIKRNTVYEAGFKAFTMIPLREEKALPKDTVMAYADYLLSLTGFETSLVYRLHNSSGLAKESLFEWIVEASFNSSNASEESVLKDLMNCPVVDKEWKISILKDYMQIKGQVPYRHPVGV